MAQKVTVAVIGGQTKTYEDGKGASTIGELKQALGLTSYTAMLNGETTSDSAELENFAYVTLAPAVKGGR